MKGKSGKNCLVQIMISPACIYSISGFDGTQNFCEFFGTADRIIFIVKNISGNADKIWFLLIDFTDKFMCMDDSGIVAEMCVSDKNNFKLICIGNSFTYRNFIRCYFNVFCMDNSPDTQTNDKQYTDSTCNIKGNP